MVAGSERRSNLEERAAWSAPRVTTSGQMTLREKDISKEWTAHGAKPRILGYISMGERVPEVITTLWKRSKTGLIAIDASLQHSWKSGSRSVGVRSSYGSMRMLKPRVYLVVASGKVLILGAAGGKLAGAGTVSLQASKPALPAKAVERPGP